MDEVILTLEQEAEAERIEDIVRAGAAAEIRGVARLLASKDNRHLLGATEFQIRDAVHRIGARALDAALSERKKGYQGSSVSCPHCCEDAKFVGYRTCRPTCLFGKIVYERAYYHCRHCKSGWFPTDVEFGIDDRQTPGAREVISLMGVLEPFEPTARHVLPRLMFPPRRCC
jgi:hypothetical protein